MEVVDIRHPPEATGNEDAGYCSSENPERTIPQAELNSPPLKENKRSPRCVDSSVPNSDSHLIPQPTSMSLEAFIDDADVPIATSSPNSPSSPNYFTPSSPSSSSASPPSSAPREVLDSSALAQPSKTTAVRVLSNDEAERVEEDYVACNANGRGAAREDGAPRVRTDAAREAGGSEYSSSNSGTTIVDRTEGDGGSETDEADGTHRVTEVVIWQEGAEGQPTRTELDRGRARSSSSSSSSGSGSGSTSSSRSNAPGAKNAEGEHARLSQILRWTTSSSSDTTALPEFMTLDDLEQELARQEQELTATVPELLESMNVSSQDLNECESRLAEEEKKHNAMVAHWQKLDEALRAHYGSSLLDRARPYFEAATQLQSTSDTVQNLVREYGEVMATYNQSKAWLRNIEESLQYGAHDVRLDAQQQEHLSKATMRVLVAQQQRDHIETCYTKVLSDFQHAQGQEDARRKEIGITAIDKVRPCFKQIERYQLELKTQEKRLDELDQKTEVAKFQYDKALGSLEVVNNSVHALRHRFTCLLDKMRRGK
eukprot:GEMP01030864.1.p1 GENE.GEMP01030864.1~~GEMP01030864.1.p1  ORF type:complete len:542 (+),score=149.39 GEMP01030864.1:53-1678(+)